MAFRVWHVDWKTGERITWQSFYHKPEDAGLCRSTSLDVLFVGTHMHNFIERMASL